MLAGQLEHQVGVEHLRFERRGIEGGRVPGVEEAGEGQEARIVGSRQQVAVQRLEGAMLLGRPAARAGGAAEDVGGLVPQPVRQDIRSPLYRGRHVQEPGLALAANGLAQILQLDDGTVRREPRQNPIFSREKPGASASPRAAMRS